MGDGELPALFFVLHRSYRGDRIYPFDFLPIGPSATYPAIVGLAGWQRLSRSRFSPHHRKGSGKPQTPSYPSGARAVSGLPLTKLILAKSPNSFKASSS